jgi:hypothetical protein
MATRSDFLLYQALTGLGQGLGSHFGRKRQKKQNDQFAQAFLGPESTPQDFVSPKSMQLAGQLTGGMAPGIGGAIANFGAQSGLASQADQASQAANQKRAQLAEMFKDPQMAAMMKQGIAQAEVSEMMPQKPSKISDMVMSVTDGVMIMDPETQELKFKKTKVADVTKVLKPGDTVWHPGTGEVLFQVPENSKMKSWMTTESRMGESGIPEERPMIVFENGSKIPVGDFGPTGKSFSLSSPMMGSAERRSWNEKIQETRRSLREFENIRDMFDPEFLTTVGRARSTAAEAMSRWNVLDLFPGEKERYEDKTKFFAAVSDRANRYIKEITGAQMSEAEASRLLKAIPNVKDDPAGFMQKLNFVMEVSEAALDQYERIFAQSGSPEAARVAGNMVVNTMMDEYGSQGGESQNKDPWEEES